MLNKKGQVLIIFVILLPLLVIVLGLLFDLVNLGLNKRKLDSVIKESVRYGLENYDLPDRDYNIEQLIYENIEDIENISIYDNNGLVISVSKKYQGIFKMLFSNNIYKIECTYYGSNEFGSIEIRKE